MAFVLGLRQAGVTCGRALAALERIDRAAFAPMAFRALAAHGDVALPLDGGQAMTRPSVIARSLAALAPGPEHRALEIGAGSGYQTAALAALAGETISTERIASLAAAAKARLPGLDVRHADGAQGVAGLFDRILVNAALARPPGDLLARLAPGGALVAPIGGPRGQRLMRFTLTSEGAFHALDCGPARYAPLLAGLA